MAKRQSKGNRVKNLQPSGIVSSDSIEFVPRSGGESEYQAIFDKVAKMEPPAAGKPAPAIKVPTPANVPVKVFLNRLSAAMRRMTTSDKKPIKPPSGYRFYRRTTVDGQVAILLVKSKSKKAA